MGSGPVCAMVWEGKDVVKTGRTILGATNPLASAPGTIRGDYAIVSYIAIPSMLQSTLTCIIKDVGRNVCHGSDAVDSAKKEIALWFSESEIQKWTPAQHSWVYEK